MTTDNAMVIVGASLGGARAAETLRNEGFDGPITLIGAEDETPYERPPLSKDYLMGKHGRDKLYYQPREWYGEHDVDLRLGTIVTAIDPAAHEIVLNDNSRLSYAKLLLTTGSSARRLPLPGADLNGVLYLREVQDSDRIKTAFESAARVVVIGGGWIGLETAAAARTAGAEVTVLEMAELPLLRVLGRELAE
ncbi:MAG: NAD(P)/FAD-dependent oxidoreductase, partial [Streptosporangiaceae bacterium]